MIFLQILLRFRVWVIALLTCGLIISCGGSRFPPAETANSPDCRPVQHTQGTTCVPLHPQRLVVLGVPSMVDAIALGVKPVGTILYFEETPPYLNGKLDGIERVGTGNQPNLEKILTLKPDLIIAMSESGLPYTQLSQIAPTVVDDWQGYPSWKKHFNFVAEVLGKTEKAEQVWAHYEQRIRELRAALGNHYQDYQDIKVSFVHLCCGSIGLDVKNSFSGMILDDIGLSHPPAQNVVSDYGIVRVSEEFLVNIDGDIIFIATSEDGAEEILEQIKRKPLWNNLKAVQRGQVYSVNYPTWRGGNPLAADAVIDDLYKYLVEGAT